MNWIVNGTTTGLLIKKIGMANTTNVKRRYQIHFTQKMLEEIDMKIEDIKNDRFLNVVDWFSFLISLIKDNHNFHSGIRSNSSTA